MLQTLRVNNMQIMELNFPSIPDEEITIGQLVILWGEIACRKIGKNLYEVYTDVTSGSMGERPSLMNISYEDLADREFKPVLPNGQYISSKFVKTAHGTKRRRPWESPSYF